MSQSYVNLYKIAKQKHKDGNGTIFIVSQHADCDNVLLL